MGNVAVSFLLLYYIMQNGQFCCKRLMIQGCELLQVSSVSCLWRVRYSRGVHW